MLKLRRRWFKAKHLFSYVLSSLRGRLCRLPPPWPFAAATIRRSSTRLWDRCWLLVPLATSSGPLSPTSWSAAVRIDRVSGGIDCVSMTSYDITTFQNKDKPERNILKHPVETDFLKKRNNNNNNWKVVFFTVLQIGIKLLFIVQLPGGESPLIFEFSNFLSFYKWLY